MLSWLPGRCLACALPTPSGTGDLCSICFADLPWCTSTGLNIPASCHTLAPLYFQGAVRDWVHQLKYANGRVQASVLGTLLLQSVRASYLPRIAQLGLPAPWYPLPEAIVPVPMPRVRWLQRGRNHATLLARPLACRLQLPIAETLVRCGPKPQDQHNLSRAERLQAMQEAFAVTSPPPARVAIVDDVLTTGATCQALATALRNAGCRQVHVWCATYTPPPQ